MNFIEEVKAAVEGRWFRSPKRKKTLKPTAEQICLEELNKPESEGLNSKRY